MKSIYVSLLAAILSLFLAVNSLAQGEPQGLAPDGAGLVFYRGSELVVSDSRGQDLRVLLVNEELDYSPASLSPDGSRVAFAAGVDEFTGLGRIFLADVRGGDVNPLNLEGIHSAYSPCFSPDGKNLVLVGASDVKPGGEDESTTATMGIYVVDATDGSARRVATTEAVYLDGGYVYANPVFSPNGGRIAFQESGSDVSGGFVIMDLEGRTLLRHPTSEEDYTPYWRPQFSPGGSKILCWTPDVSGGDENWILLVDIENGQSERLTRGMHPTFVDNGRAVVFERTGRDGDYSTDLWRMELNSPDEPVKIVEGGRAPAGPAISGGVE